MKKGKIKFTGYLTLFTFIIGWIIGNLTFPAVSVAMTADHVFKFTVENGNSHIVFFHADEEEHDIFSSTDKEKAKIVQIKEKSHEHKFLLPDYDHDLTITDNPAFKIDTERGPPFTYISEAFDFLPRDVEYYFKDYKYPSGTSTSSFALKTVILLN